MPLSEAERRRAVRRSPEPDETLGRVRLRTGRDMTVVNISTAGMLVESVTRLLPGTRAEVHVVTRRGRVLVRTRVIRSFVWRLESDLVCYRAALAFDTDVDTEAPALNGYLLPGEFPSNVEGRGIPYPNDEVDARV